MKRLPAGTPGWAFLLSYLYGAGVWLRNKLFDWKIFKSKSFDIPVICIGNIAVGGTGKTPHTEYLIELLQDKYQIAVLSRGYKRQSSGYILADEYTSALDIGDEPYQIKQKYPNVIVAVSESRQLGIEQLLTLTNPKVDVVLLDDGYQHRYVEAGLNILLTDYNNPFYDDRLMPAGKLREPISGKSRAHIIIATKCPEVMTPIAYKIVLKGVELAAYQELFFSSFEYKNLKPVFPEEEIQERSLSTIRREEDVLLVTGIASPDLIASELEKYTKRIHLITYEDHHNFTDNDIDSIVRQFSNLDTQKRIIVTTEKDAARLIDYPYIPDIIKKNIYVLPIKVRILQNQQEALNKKITDYVRTNKRNSFLS